MEPFFHGFILAIGLILPLGVQNLFVFNQGAVQPVLLYALPAVMAAAVCDTVMIILAVQGVSLLLLKASFLKQILIGVGVLFLLYLGWLTWRSADGLERSQMQQGLSAWRQILFAVSVSLLNPHAVLDTIGVIGTSAISYQGQERVLFTTACILVSWLWFFGLAALGRTLRSKDIFSQGAGLFNKISALFIWGSAVYMLATVF
jgi:L-lysine exporter family protein LysE/ArgO